MTSTFDAFRQKFRLPELVIHEHEHWTISLRPHQPTLGALVLSARRACERLADLTTDETAELAIAFTHIESALSSAFNPSKFNYLALMMIDPQVHFHILPRYDSERVISGRSFQDTAWPGPPSLDGLNMTEAELQEVLHILKLSFN